jgi:Tol biopolymer transport system component
MAKAAAFLAICSTFVALPSAGANARAGGTFIVFNCGLYHANLCGLVPETGEWRQLTNDDPRTIRYQAPSLSRDGTRLSFALSGQAYVSSQNAEGRVPIRGVVNVGATSMRPDGRRIALRSEPPCPPWPSPCRRRSTTRIVTRAGNVVQRIRGLPPADWAGAGLVFAVPHNGGGSAVYLLTGPRFEQRKVVISARETYFSRVAVSPDAEHAVLRVSKRRSGEYREHLAILSLRTGKLRRLPATGASDLAPEWSPDGRTIVFARYGGSSRPASYELYVVGADGRSPPRSLGIQGSWPTWGLRVAS